MTKYSTDRRTVKLLCAHLHTRQAKCGTTGQCISTFLAARYCRRLPGRASSPTPERKKKQLLLENNVISNGQMSLIVGPPNSVSVSRDETTAQAKRLTGSPTTRSVSPPGWPCQPQRVASSEPGRQPSTGTNYYKGQGSPSCLRSRSRRLSGFRCRCPRQRPSVPNFSIHRPEFRTGVSRTEARSRGAWSAPRGRKASEMLGTRVCSAIRFEKHSPWSFSSSRWAKLSVYN